MSRPGFVRAATSPTPADAWAALAPLLAARGRMRLSKDGGRNYRTVGERYVDPTLPNQPAAVLLYDKTGCAPVVCFDLDAKLGDTTRDLAALARLLDRHHAAWFSDSSPNGGRHVYVPLAEPAPLHEVRQLMHGLVSRTPSLDPKPMLNIISGCIRPPGARHRTGGHQQLDGSISRAVATFHRPLSLRGWRALVEEVADKPLEQLADARPSGSSASEDAQERLDPLRGYNAPDPEFTAIARTGEWPADRYKTASEARQGVVWACVASGWSLADVALRIYDGTWRGLASFYARYTSDHRHAALANDWREAVAFEAERRRKQTGSKGRQSREARTKIRDKSVRQRTTSPQKTHAGPPHTSNGSAAIPSNTGLSANQEVRVWLAAVDFLSPTLNVTAKAVLYALAEAASVTARVEVEHGNRSLAIAAGLDQATVGRVLKELRSAPADRLLVDLVREAESTRANTYALVVPALLRPACERKPWRRGRIYAIRPVFRELGMVAAFMYGVLEIADEPLGGREIARRAGVGHDAAYRALASLAAWGMAERVTGPGGGWKVGAASLSRLAEQFGCDEKVAAQAARYRAEREAWWRYLGLIDGAGSEPPVEDEIRYLDEPEQPPWPGQWERTNPIGLHAVPEPAPAPPPAPPSPPPRFDYGLFDRDPLVEFLARELEATIVETRPVRRA